MTTAPDQQPANPAPNGEQAVAPAAQANEAAAPAVANETSDVSLAGEAMNLLSEHKGKLAIGVAATLGMMVYYGWREKRLAKTDPEEYARLQRLKAVVRHSDDPPRQRPARKAAAASQAGERSAVDDAGTPPGPDATPDIS